MNERTDAAAWARLRSREACVICHQGRPKGILTELESSWVTVKEDASVRGYVCLVLRRHAIEFHDLSESEGAAFMRDIRRLSGALQAVTRAIKLNYEVHGNTIPHLHMHFYPRFPGDRLARGTVGAKRLDGPGYEPGEFAAFRARLLDALLRRDTA